MLNIKHSILIILYICIICVVCNRRYVEFDLDKLIDPSYNITLLVTVIKILCVPEPEPSEGNWMVVASVDSVISGEFPFDTISIRIHSPARSLAEVGKQSIIKLKHDAPGYHIEPMQLFKPYNRIPNQSMNIDRTCCRD